MQRMSARSAWSRRVVAACLYVWCWRCVQSCSACRRRAHAHTRPCVRRARCVRAVRATCALGASYGLQGECGALCYVVSVARALRKMRACTRVHFTACACMQVSEENYLPRHPTQCLPETERQRAGSPGSRGPAADECICSTGILTNKDKSRTPAKNQVLWFGDLLQRKADYRARRLSGSAMLFVNLLENRSVVLPACGVVSCREKKECCT